MGGFDGPIYLAIRRSASLERVLAAIHAFLALIILLAHAPWWGKVIGVALVAANWVCRRRGVAGENAADVTALTLGSNDGWTMTRADGSTCEATLARVVLVHPLLTVFDLVEQGAGATRPARCRMHLLADNVAAAPFRRLRVRLRYRRAPETAANV